MAWPSELSAENTRSVSLVNGLLKKELDICSSNRPTRTKAHIFSVRGKQFAIVVGSIDKDTGLFSTKRTRVVLERCEPPLMNGIEPMHEEKGGARLGQRDSELNGGNQANFLVADELALKRLLRWYAGLVV